ncbi:MAG TPA: hypothetical protein VIV14_01590 [Gammaproteobacteria bacterium]
MASFLGEIKRRKVFQVATVYLIVAWLIMQVVDVINEPLSLPDWFDTVVILLLAIGFPIAAILSWAFDLTPAGIERTGPASPADRTTKPKANKLNYAIIAVLLLALAFVAFERYVPRTATETPAGTADRRSIAVLPLENLSPDPDNAYFADGIHDDLLTQLSKIGALKVISRTSVMGYRDTDKNIRTIGGELGVATILEGGVRRAGDAVRINVQLIDAETDEHLWAETYDRQLSAENIFAIQREMATSIASALQAMLSPQETARLNELPTRNTQAYDFFLTGNEYFRRNDRIAGTPLAVQMYTRAVEEDPEFALAFAALSRAHSRMVWWGVDRSDSRRDMARDAVQRALELAPDLPEAHLAMGYYYYRCYRDYDNALAEFAVAELGMPGGMEIFEARSIIQRRLAQWEESLANLERAIELDPRNNVLPYEQALTYLLLDDTVRADEYFDRALELAPDDVTSYLDKFVLSSFYKNGDVAALNAAIENAPMQLGDLGRGSAVEAALYERRYDAALELLADFESDVYQDITWFSPPALMRGEIYDLSGQPELARPAYEIARAQVEAALETASEDPRLYVALGTALAGLGESEAAVRAARRAIELLPTSRDAFFGPGYQLGAAMVLIAAGDHDAAFEELDAYFAAPRLWSIDALAPHPRVDPIRDDPRFQALIEKYGR